MVARIAPSPIVTSVASSEAQTQAVADSSSIASGSFGGGSNALATMHDVAQSTPSLPPGPPGEAFAAALIAGQLPPRPMTPEQLRQRLGSAWQPPASPLRLMDRTA